MIVLHSLLFSISRKNLEVSEWDSPRALRRIHSATVQGTCTTGSLPVVEYCEYNMYVYRSILIIYTENDVFAKKSLRRADFLSAYDLISNVLYRLKDSN